MKIDTKFGLEIETLVNITDNKLYNLFNAFETCDTIDKSLLNKIPDAKLKVLLKPFDEFAQQIYSH